MPEGPPPEGAPQEKRERRRKEGRMPRALAVISNLPWRMKSSLQGEEGIVSPAPGLEKQEARAPSPGRVSCPA